MSRNMRWYLLTSGVAGGFWENQASHGAATIGSCILVGLYTALCLPGLMLSLAFPDVPKVLTVYGGSAAFWLILRSMKKRKTASTWHATDVDIWEPAYWVRTGRSRTWWKD